MIDILETRLGRNSLEIGWLDDPRRHAPVRCNQEQL